jgi:hypothetical protein
MGMSGAMRIGEPDFVFDSMKKQIPRRIVRLKGDDKSEVNEVLATYEGSQTFGSKIHAELHNYATKHPGETVAIEWLGNMGWVRFATCRE